MAEMRNQGRPDPTTQPRVTCLPLLESTTSSTTSSQTAPPFHLTRPEEVGTPFSVSSASPVPDRLWDQVSTRVGSRPLSSPLRPPILEGKTWT